MNRFHLAFAMLGFVAVGLAAPLARASTYTYGLGAALRAGYFAGVSSSGVSITGRADMIALEGGMLSGSDDIKSSLDPISSFGFPSPIDSASIAQKGVYAMLKLHPAKGGSFYFGFGGARTQSVGTLKAHDDSGKLDETMKVTRTMGTVSLGNVWTPGGVMIGCEWVGLAHALKSQEEITSNSTPDSDLKDLQSSFYDKVRSTTKSSTGNLLLVYLGYMFGH